MSKTIIVFVNLSHSVIVFLTQDSTLTFLFNNVLFINGYISIRGNCIMKKIQWLTDGD